MLKDTWSREREPQLLSGLLIQFILLFLLLCIANLVQNIVFQRSTIEFRHFILISGYRSLVAVLLVTLAEKLMGKNGIMVKVLTAFLLAFLFFIINISLISSLRGLPIPSSLYFLFSGILFGIYAGVARGITFLILKRKILKAIDR